MNRNMNMCLTLTSLMWATILVQGFFFYFVWQYFDIEKAKPKATLQYIPMFLYTQ